MKLRRETYVCVWSHLVSTLSGYRVLYAEKQTHEDKQLKIMSIEYTVCDADTCWSVPEAFKYRVLCVSPLGHCKANSQGNHNLAARGAFIVPG